MAKSGVKDEIINFDAHRISPESRKKVADLLKKKAASFDPKVQRNCKQKMAEPSLIRDALVHQNAKRASVAAAPLAAWVKANLQYSAIVEKIAPLENEKMKIQK